MLNKACFWAKNLNLLACIQLSGNNVLAPSIRLILN